jgi:hypothetical protein
MDNVSPIINPETGQPFSQPPVDVPVAGSPVGQNNGLIAGVAVYNADGTFDKFIAADDQGKLLESFTVLDGQIVCMLVEIARAAPRGGSTVARVGATLERVEDPT